MVNSEAAEAANIRSPSIFSLPLMNSIGPPTLPVTSRRKSAPAFVNATRAESSQGILWKTMSEENLNVELLEDAFAAINRSDLETFLSLTDSEVEFHSLIAELEGQTYRGHDGVREWWEQVKGALGGLRFEAEAIRSEGDWAVVQVLATSRLGDVAVPQRMWQATRARNGKAIWWGIYRTEGEALEAAGLSG